MVKMARLATTRYAGVLIALFTLVSIVVGTNQVAASRAATSASVGQLATAQGLAGSLSRHASAPRAEAEAEQGQLGLLSSLYLPSLVPPPIEGDVALPKESDQVIEEQPSVEISPPQHSVEAPLAQADAEEQPSVGDSYITVPRRIITPGTEVEALDVPLNAPSHLVLPPIALKEEVTLRSPNEVRNELVLEEVKEPEPVIEPVIGTANRVTVPSIQIDMPVRSGVYDTATSTWEVDDSSAFHADITVPVNDTNGTALIYGHAKWGIFGNLPDVREGAEAIVYTDEGLRFVYVFESVRQVDPSDVSMLTASGAPKLVLQTCSGFFDQYRTIATFSLKEVIQ